MTVLLQAAGPGAAECDHWCLAVGQCAAGDPDQPAGQLLRLPPQVRAAFDPWLMPPSDCCRLFVSKQVRQRGSGYDPFSHHHMCCRWPASQVEGCLVHPVDCTTATSDFSSSYCHQRWTIREKLPCTVCVHAGRQICPQWTRHAP